jgi:hypothetical protein
MGTDIDATEIAAALLVEARALVAAEASSSWPIRAGRGSALGVLTTTWAAYPRRDVNGSKGFALARRALRAGASDAVLSKASPSDVRRHAFDRALKALVGDYSEVRSRSSAQELMQ